VRVGAIDIGTNTVRLLVADVVAGAVVDVERRAEVVGLGEGVDRTGVLSVEAMRQAMIERSPLRRMVTADDIVDATVFFCSDMARSISGQVLAVNAGEPAG